MALPVTEPPIPRDALGLPDDVAYLDTAYAAPLPVAVAAAVAADAGDAAGRGSGALADRADRAVALRGAWAGLLGVEVDDVALAPNTTHGLGVVAAGLDWSPGDVVLVAEEDHPTTVLPWRAQAHRGVEVRAVPLAGLAGAVATTARLRVVAVSWVQAHDGTRTDLAALASVVHAAGALLCVDLIQGAGAIPCDLGAWGVDASAAGAQKWLLGPHGIGLATLAPALRERLTPTTLSLGSVEAGTTAARFEAGAPNHAGVAGALAAAGLLEEVGVDAIWRWAGGLADRLRERASAAGLTVAAPGGAVGSTLVTVAVPGRDAVDVVAALARRGVVASARGPGVRLSPAGWTTEQEVDLAVDVMARA